VNCLRSTPSRRAVWRVAPVATPASLVCFQLDFKDLALGFDKIYPLGFIDGAGKRRVCRGRWQQRQPFGVGSSNLGPA